MTDPGFPVGSANLVGGAAERTERNCTPEGRAPVGPPGFVTGMVNWSLIPQMSGLQSTFCHYGLDDDSG